MRLLKAFLTALAVMCDAFEFLCLLVEILMKDFKEKLRDIE